MVTFLVEAYLPVTIELQDVERRAARAADDLAPADAPVRFLRSIYVAEDETCFLLFEAASADAVRRVVNRARLRAQRIVEALEHPPATAALHPAPAP